MVELLAAIAIIAALTTASLYFVGGYVQYAQQNADKQTLTVLNDALTRYKCEGGNVAALTAGAPLSHIITALKTPVTWGGSGGIGHQFLRTSFTVPAYSLYVTGNNGSYMFSGYNSYTATAGGSHGGNVSHSIVNFTSAGTTTWTVPAGVYSAEVLVVAGGGGGATGGGGGGSVIHQSSYNLTPGRSITVTVGTGGAAGNGGNIAGSGSNSVLDTLVAIGGGAGGGGGGATSTGASGGSGGGGDAGFSGGNGTAGQGSNGASGSAIGGGGMGGGGGGGAGAQGSNGVLTSGGGNGGNGLQFSTSGTPTYYGGGGGGGTQGTAAAGSAGGLGGGGVGGWEWHYNGSAGNTNTGGGGGGAWNTVRNGTGGSGIVIINY